MSAARILEELQSGALQQIPAYEGGEHYQAFADIPFSDKASLRFALTRYLARDLPVENLWQVKTFGTTAAPVTLAYSRRFYFDYLYLTFRKMLASAALGSSLPPGSLSICVNTTDDGPESMTVDPLDPSCVTLTLTIDPGDRGSLARLFELIARLDPLIVASRPSVFEMMSAYAEAFRPEIAIAPRCVVSAGAFLSDHLRDQAETLLGARILSCYGLTEFGLVATECQERSGYHVDESSVFVEVVDAEGRPAPDGAIGEVVLSSVANTAMPLIRFRTGDLGSLDRGKCPCGVESARIPTIVGRQAFTFELPSGVRVNAVRFNSLLWKYPIRDYQVVQTRSDEFDVLVEPIGLDDFSLLRGAIQRDLVESLLPGVSVAVRPTSFGPRTGVERHVSRVKGRHNGTELLNDER